VDLQDVNVRSQALDASLNGVEDVFPAQTNAVDKVAVVGRHGRNGRLLAGRINPKVALGQDDYVGARNLVMAQSLANNLFTASVGVDVGRVPADDASFVRMLEQREGFVFVENPLFFEKRTFSFFFLPSVYDSRLTGCH
jgi:hypothetical protein